MTRAEVAKVYVATTGNDDLGKQLRWWQRDSFFYPRVQAVLKERHPSVVTYKDPHSEGFPVYAWEMAEQASISLPLRLKGSHLYWDVIQVEPLWGARLLVAVLEYRESLRERHATPKTALDHYQNWRDERVLWERPGPDFEDEALGPASWTEAQTAIWKTRGLRLEGNAVKQAWHKENARRERIMAHWSECWVEYLGLDYEGKAVTGNPEISNG